jgi:hypothetical protein
MTAGIIFHKICIYVRRHRFLQHRTCSYKAIKIIAATAYGGGGGTTNVQKAYTSKETDDKLQSMLAPLKEESETSTLRPVYGQRPL